MFFVSRSLDNPVRPAVLINFAPNTRLVVVALESAGIVDNIGSRNTIVLESAGQVKDATPKLFQAMCAKGILIEIGIKRYIKLIQRGRLLVLLYKMQYSDVLKTIMIKT